jgi:hypothetical protein
MKNLISQSGNFSESLTISGVSVATGAGAGGSAVWAEAGAEVTYSEGTSSTRKLGWGTASPVAHIDLRVENGNGGNIFFSPEPGPGRGFAGLPNNDDCNNAIISSVASKMGRTESQEIFNNTILGGESLNITGSKNQPSEFNLLMGGSTCTIHNSTNSTAIANYGLMSGTDYSLLLGGRSSKRPRVTGDYEAVLAFDNLITHSGHKTLITGDADGGNLAVAGRVGIKTNGPTSALDIHGTISLNSSGVTTRGIWFGSGGQALGYLGPQSWAVNGLTAEDFGISSAKSDNVFTGALAFGIGAVEKMRIAYNGNVGIGTTDPQGLLDVSGAVVAQSFEGRAAEPLSLYGSDGKRKLRTFLASNGMVLGLGDDTPSSDDLIRLDARSASPNASWMNSGPFAVGATGFPGLTPKFMVVDSTNIAGQVLVTNTVTDSTTKYGGIMSPHYDNSEEPLRLIAGGVGPVTSNVYIGGGLDGNANAATDISFFTATGQVTQVGSERMKIDNSGNVMVGYTTGNHKFGVETADNEEFAASIVNYGGDGKGLFVKTFGGPLEEYPILDLENTEGNVFRVQSNGHVGIRMANVDSTPNYPLTVGQNSAVVTGTMTTSDFCSMSARSATRAAHFGLYGRNTTDGVGYINWHVDNGAAYYIWTDNVGILRTSTTLSDVGAQLGSVIGEQTSDKRLKDVKSGFSYGLDAVNLLNPVKYSLKNHSGLFSGEAPEYLGLLAQEVSGIVPQVVKESDVCVDGYTSGDRNSPDNILRINYGEMVPVLVKAVQELSTKVEELESRLDS